MTIFTDADTISTSTKIVYVETSGYTETNFIQCTSSVEYIENQIIPGGFWGPFDTDDGII